MTPQSISAHYRSIWRRRDLIWQLALKNFKVRYKSPRVTFLWAVIKPLAMLLIFGFLFSIIGDRFAVGLPYALFFLSGFVTWTLFSGAVQESTLCILSNPDLIKRVYFPREIIPLSTVVENSLSFGITFLLLLVLIGAYRVIPGAHPWHFLGTLGLLIMLTTGAALGAAALCTAYRDVRHVIELGMTLLFYATPIFYPVHLVPADMRLYYFLNPLAGITVMMRHSLLGYGEYPDYVPLLASAVSGVTCLAGMLIFRRVEPRLADYL